MNKSAADGPEPGGLLGADGLAMARGAAAVGLSEDGPIAEPVEAVATGHTIVARQMLFRRLLGLADAISISMAVAISTIVVGGDALRPAALFVPPMVIILAKAMGLYDRDAELLHKTTLDEVPKLLGLTTGVVLLLWLADGLLVDGVIERPQVMASWLIFFAGLISLRSAARSIAVRTSPIERCLYLGDAAGAEEFQERLATSHAVRAELVGWLPASSDDDEIAKFGFHEQIRATIVERDVHRVVLGPGASDDELLDAVRRIKDNGVKVSVIPDVARLVNASVELDRLNGITMLGLRRFEITLSSRFIKRTFDVVGSTFALLVTAPVLVITAMAVKFDSRGPVLFRQERAGRHGETFEMFKFRSMIDGADGRKEDLRHLNEAEGVFKIAHDPRVTRAGRIIRALHVDELPQLINVVRGEMSLVGPRPLPLDEDRRIEGWHRRRLDLRPGMTGPWQVMGSSRIPVREMVKIDYQYVADWSLWNDVRILLLTLGHVAQRRGQ